MELFDVYPLMDLEPVTAKGVRVQATDGRTYLDLYGGHAVISVGHAHPHYVERLTSQAKRIGFYSNAVRNPLQVELAHLLGEVSGLGEYALFLCNSGAEANENALKLASFHTGRKRIVAFTGAFHGRTSAAVAATDDPSIIAPVNSGHEVVFVPLNDAAAAEQAITTDTAAVIVEGIQGVGGVQIPTDEFLRALRALCDRSGALLILDEVQSGYGRSGDFFAFQRSGVQPDLITVAKGMGNGFPIGGVLVHSRIEAKHGLLGTTFGGNHLACAAAIAVLEIIREEALLANTRRVGDHLLHALAALPGVTDLRGRGLMIGLDLHGPSAAVRNTLLKEHRLLVGSAKDKRTIRLLPPLTLTMADADEALAAFGAVLRSIPDPVRP
ncbi:MAG: aspartate aminotransferase family protein [Flavobacteriales bacterium]